MVIIDDFVFCVQKNKFFHIPSGFPWKVGGINAVCEPIEVNGKLIKPTEWIKKNARVETMPIRKTCSPLDR